MIGRKTNQDDTTHAAITIRRMGMPGLPAESKWMNLLNMAVLESARIREAPILDSSRLKASIW